MSFLSKAHSTVTWVSFFLEMKKGLCVFSKREWRILAKGNLKVYYINVLVLSILNRTIIKISIFMNKRNITITHSLKSSKQNKKNLHGYFLWIAFNYPKATEPLRGGSLLFYVLLSSQKFLVLIWSTLEGWKAESTLEPPSGFEQRTPGFGIQHLNH